MTGLPHPFDTVAQLDAAEGGGLELLHSDDGRVVRLRDSAAGLWILMKSENGSMWDRWSDSGGLRFVMIDEPLRKDPEAILSRIDAARARPYEPEQPSFRSIETDGDQK